MMWPIDRLVSFGASFCARIFQLKIVKFVVTAAELLVGILSPAKFVQRRRNAENVKRKCLVREMEFQRVADELKSGNLPVQPRNQPRKNESSPLDKEFTVKQTFERNLQTTDSYSWVGPYGDMVAQKRSNITNMGFIELQRSLQEGRITASEAVDAYRWKALEAHNKYNCVTQFISEAPEWAASLDRAFSGKDKPPLFGLPFSLKDNFFMKGYDSCRGLGEECFMPRTSECTIVTQLRDHSPVYGTTENPHMIGRSPGGSSGGEGCLVAAGGAAFGIGGDLLGSLRIPAHFSGLCTLKPTSGRLKILNTHSGIPGMSRLGQAYGFFTRDMEAQRFLWEHFLNDEYFEMVPSTAPIPFSQQKNGTPEKFPLKIGYFVDDGWFTPVPSCARAVEESKKILESLGHELVPFQVPRPYEALQIMTKVLLPDNGQCLFKHWETNETDKFLIPTRRLLSVPLWIRGLLSKVLSPVWPMIGAVLKSYVRTPGDLRASFEAADDYVKSFTQQAWLWNLLDYPVGVIPVTRVTEEDDRKLMTDYPTVPAASSSIFGLKYPLYSIAREGSKNSVGLPVGVQIATLPFQEELCMHILEILHENIN